jgi:hypothetical protein
MKNAIKSFVHITCEGFNMLTICQVFPWKLSVHTFKIVMDDLEKKSHLQGNGGIDPSSSEYRAYFVS